MSKPLENAIQLAKIKPKRKFSYLQNATCLNYYRINLKNILIKHNEPLKCYPLNDFLRLQLSKRDRKLIKVTLLLYKLQGLRTIAVWKNYLNSNQTNKD
jgi:hypothetical protein